MSSVRVMLASLLIGLVVLSGAASAQAITPSPQALSFVYQIGGPNPGAQNVVLTAGVPTDFSASASGATWLSVSPTAGVTPATLVVAVTPPPNVAPGTYSGSIIVGPMASVDAVKTVVAVSLQVIGPAQGNLVVVPNSVSFEYRVGGPAPSPIAVTISSTGSPASFTMTTSSPWIGLSASSYVTPSMAYISIISPSGLAPGTYNGQVNVIPSYTGGVRQQIYVTLRVLATGNLTATPSYLNFSYQAGGPLPLAQTFTVVNTTGVNGAFSCAPATSSGGLWLGCSPASAVTPATLVVSVNPAALAPGTYYGNLNLNSGTPGVGATMVPVTLTILNYSQLQVQPTNLEFGYQQGGPTPSTQYLSVTSTGTPVSYTVGLSGPGWVTVSAASGTTPTGLGVSAKPSPSTPTGMYTATLTLLPTNGGGTAVTVPISVGVSAPNYLTVGRSSLSFNYSVGGANPPPVAVPVSSSGGPLRFEVTAATLGFGNWLSAKASSYITPDSITIGVAPQGLTPGTYTGSVIVTADGASNGEQSIEVTLNVTSTPSFTASPFGLVFSHQMQGDAPDPQVLVVSSQGTAIPFTVTTTTASGGNWLMAAGKGPTPATVAVGVNAAALGPGTYTGQVQIKSSDTDVPMLQVPVVLQVSPSPVYLPSSNQLAFQYQTNGPAPAAQKITIESKTGPPVVFYPTILTADGGTWLTVAPDVDVTPADLTVTVDPTKLAPGAYYGLVGITDPAGVSPTTFVPVTLQVSDNQILTVAAQSIVFQTQIGMSAPAPETILVSGTGRTSAFHVTTYGGSWLRASPTDGFTNAQVSVTVTPDGLGPGYYLGVVVIEIPGVPNSQQYVPVALVIAPGF